MIDNPFEHGAFRLGEPEPEELPAPAPYLPWLQDTAAWEMYTDAELYQFEKDFRAWMAHMVQDPQWVKSVQKRKYTYKMLIRAIYGIEIGDVRYSGVWMRKRAVYDRMLLWYTQTVGKSMTDPSTGKRVNQKVYCLSVQRYRKAKPYGLKLRLEWYRERGVEPSAQQMFYPRSCLEDDGRVSRSTKTQLARERRAERARATHNAKMRERYNAMGPEEKRAYLDANLERRRAKKKLVEELRGRAVEQERTSRVITNR